MVNETVEQRVKRLFEALRQEEFRDFLECSDPESVARKLRAENPSIPEEQIIAYAMIACQEIGGRRDLASEILDYAGLSHIKIEDIRTPAQFEEIRRRAVCNLRKIVGESAELRETYSRFLDGWERAYKEYLRTSSEFPLLDFTEDEFVQCPSDIEKKDKDRLCLGLYQFGL